MAPAVSAAADVLSSIAMKFSNLSGGTKKTIVVIAALVAAIGPLIFAVGALNTAFAFLAANPIVLIITAVIVVIAAWAAAIFYVVRNWDALTERFSDVGWWRNAIIDMAAFFIRYNPASLFIKGINYLIDIWQNTEWFKKGLIMMGQAFLNFNPIDLLIKSINKVASYMGKELIKPVVGVQKEIEKSGAIPNPFESMARGLEGLKVETKGYTKEVETLGEAFEGVKEKVNKLTGTDTKKPPIKTGPGEKDLTEKQQKKGLGKLKQELYEIKSGLKKINDTPILPVVNIEGINKGVEKIEQESIPKFNELGKKLGDALSSGLKDLATEGLVSFGQFLGDVMSGGDMTIQDFGRGLLDSIGKFMGQFGEAMIAMGIAQTILDASIKTGNGPAAIVGGVALVAAGAALSNLSKKGIDKGGGVTDTDIGGGVNFNNQNGSPGYMMQLETKVSGRDIILVQERERAFKR